MYPNVRAEMARRKITLTMLANYLKRSVSATSGKLSGDYPITFKEAILIREFVAPEMSLEELFEEGE